MNIYLDELLISLMEVEDGGRNIVSNTYNRNPWLRYKCYLSAYRTSDIF